MSQGGNIKLYPPKMMKQTFSSLIPLNKCITHLFKGVVMTKQSLSTAIRKRRGVLCISFSKSADNGAEMPRQRSGDGVPSSLEV